nr:ClpXP adapter SpxH family protein [Alkalihalobacillus trypoxylicola]
MNPKKNQTCNNIMGVCGLDPTESSSNHSTKPIEIYAFIDPLCPECWSFEPIIKKLKIEYGPYFRIRILLAGGIKAWNSCQDPKKVQERKAQLSNFWNMVASKSGMCCDGDFWLEQNQWDSPYLASLAIKAAELQGPQAGAKFLRKLREKLFLEKKDVTNSYILKECSQDADLDVEEFIKDLYSDSAKQALSCDMISTSEMNVDSTPTFVFFNDNVEEDGIKISGSYAYDIYVQILTEMLGFIPKKAPKMSIEQFIQKYEFVATVEIAVVFDLTTDEVEKTLKQLVLQQKVEKVSVKHGMFWRYIPTDS